MKPVILDTDILSYISEARYPEVMSAARQYSRINRRFTISAITVCEVVEGLERGTNPYATASFLAQLETYELLPIEVESATLAGQITGSLHRAGLKIGELDPLIAATAIVCNRPLVTNNQRHYQRVVDLGFALQLDNWRSS